MRPPCLVCAAGQPHARCGAHRNDGQPCGRWPEKGATVCRQCGGAAPQVKAAAARRREEEAARQAAATFALPVEIDPGTALLEEVHRTAGVIAWLEVRVENVAGVSPESLIFGTMKQTSRMTPDGNTTSTEEGAAVHVWLKLWQEERAHLVKVCAAALAAGVAERQVRLAEQQGTLLAQVIRGILADLNLTPAQEAAAGEVAARHLRAVRAG